MNFLFRSMQSRESIKKIEAHKTLDFYDHNLSQRTIRENEQVQEKINSLSRAKLRDQARKKHISHLDRANTRQMLNRAKKNLIKSKFILQNILDDGKTTMQMKPFKEYEIYLLPNSGVYYHLERDQFKDKAFLLMTYQSPEDVMVYVDKKSPRPSSNSCDLILKSPKMIPLNNTFFEFSSVFLCFKCDQSCNITVTPYPNKESLPVKSKARESIKKKLTLRERQALLLKNGTKIADISKTRHEIDQKMTHLADYPTQLEKFKQRIAMIKSNKLKNHSSIDANIEIAENWGSFRKMKLDRLSSATRLNSSLVIKKRKRIERLKRNRETNTTYWERKKKEKQETERQIKIQHIRLRCIIVWNSQVILTQYFSDVARRYNRRREEIEHRRNLTLAIIKIAAKMRYKLKKFGPSYNIRATGLIRNGLNFNVNNMHGLCVERSKIVLRMFLQKNDERLKLRAAFFTFHQKICATKNRLISKMVMKKTRMKLLAEYWNHKLFSMMDRYKDSYKKIDKDRIKLNKLKGISTLVKEVMILRYYDQCRLEYCLKFFTWRKKCKEFIKTAEEDNLYEALSIARRKSQIKAAEKLTEDIILSDHEDDSHKKKSRLTAHSKHYKRSGAPKKYQKHNKRLHGPPILADSLKMEAENIDVLDKVKSIKVPMTRLGLQKSVSKAKAILAKACMNYPPQMNFVPSEELLEKLIWAATKYRYAKDIPRVL
ncbi:unnamed protein product [Moneuplotes crassus]|uniref:Uncharacterized protein n=1 Tax=Euplotes crassus TaxID=5936 RepID=A0AAD1Y5T9_EUPCR|nr:unnamed protein product [Moneuplotes crassus]